MEFHTNDTDIMMSASNLIVRTGCDFLFQRLWDNKQFWTRATFHTISDEIPRHSGTQILAGSFQLKYDIFMVYIEPWGMIFQQITESV